jgi:Fe-S oxidoreductase
MDQLLKYQFDKIFPGCRLLDIHEYLLEKGVQLDATRLGGAVRYMYHEPCHTPMKTYQSLQVVNKLMNTQVTLNDRCCGESGTWALSNPHIATQVRFRKEEEINKGAEALRSDGFTGDVKILTSCPACQLGLSRYVDDTDTTPDYIVVEMAKYLLGENWMADYVQKANNGGIERVLL